MTYKLRGVATINIWAKNHADAVEWYSAFLGQRPYFEQPGYAEFRVGEYATELGIIDSAYSPFSTTNKPTGTVVYWQVDDIEKTLKELLDKGATQLEASKDRGNGFVTATVADPFGNILGIMENPHFIEVLGMKS